LTTEGKRANQFLSMCRPMRTTRTASNEEQGCKCHDAERKQINMPLGDNERPKAFMIQCDGLAEQVPGYAERNRRCDKEQRCEASGTKLAIHLQVTFASRRCVPSCLYRHAAQRP
jgi:hypothetical protein